MSSKRISKQSSVVLTICRELYSNRYSRISLYRTTMVGSSESEWIPFWINIRLWSQRNDQLNDWNLNAKSGIRGWCTHTESVLLTDTEQESIWIFDSTNFVWSSYCKPCRIQFFWIQKNWPNKADSLSVGDAVWGKFLESTIWANIRVESKNRENQSFGSKHSKTRN